ncbi:MAG: purine-nucleoside phosphorylase [Deltaproteobacteria bacterium]|jgi:purine-nucleoside phosphorylase|nr:purine-nucleoside phosphorylase [Deltaproteobacteria bacterium]
MTEIKRKVEEAADSIRPHLKGEQAIGLVLGTGLGGIVDAIEKGVAIPYGDIPHHPVCTAPGHQGRMILGKWAGRSVIALDGRFHLYEGFTPKTISFPIRVLRALGTKMLVISNAAGGLNPNFQAGDLMVISDHINFTGQNPLVGPNEDDWGVRFPDMTEPYNKGLVDLTEKTALKQGIKLHRGVYAAVIGPSLETAAETRFLRIAGADAVGMSTIMEVITAVHAGMDVLAVSVITNVNLPDAYKPAVIEDIIQTAASSGRTLGRLFEKVLEQC